MKKHEFWLAPLRGVTIRAFREAFGPAIKEAGFVGAFAPFIPANPGIRVTDKLLDELRPFPRDFASESVPGVGDFASESVLGERDFASESVSGERDFASEGFEVVPQVITKDPGAMCELIKGFKDRGFKRVDLNAGCPFPMIRRRGRGSGLIKNPDLLELLLEAGCKECGDGKFSLKIRLGLDRPDELLSVIERINRYPLAVLTIHARTAKQMYDGTCDLTRFNEVVAVSKNPVMYNGDWGIADAASFDGIDVEKIMVGRGFVRSLGERDDVKESLRRYIEISRMELNGDRPVLGRMKELIAYWNHLPRWRKTWDVVKICRTVDELLSVVR